MKNENSSQKEILRSSSIIGSASVINIALGLLRLKVLAIFFGPAGVGIVGIFQNLMATASTISALGLANVGTRQVAEAMGRGDQGCIDSARRALLWATTFLSVIGSLSFFFMHDLIAQYVLSDSSLSTSVGWISLGVGLSVAAGSQSALLRGMRRVGDLARVSIFSSLWSTLLGLAFLFLLPDPYSLIWFVLATPLASLAIGHWYVAKLPPIESSKTPFSVMLNQWKELAQLGVSFMVAGLATILGQLLVRSIIQSELGVQELGYFQASWVISMTYIGFVLNAMGSDYYPRLAVSIHNKKQVNRLVNEQAQVSILLAAPVLLAMLGGTPLVLELLYSEEFLPAADILRWQIMGDILKVASWPVGFVILAAGKGTIFMLTEIFVATIFVFMTWVLLPVFGISSSGLAFFLMYFFHLPLMMLVVFSITGFKWEASVVLDFILLAVASIIIFILGGVSEFLGILAGAALSLIFALYSFTKLTSVTIDAAGFKVISKKIISYFNKLSI